MAYKLKTRKTKLFELYNNLEKSDLVELGFLLRLNEAPRLMTQKIEAEHLWVKIGRVVLEANEIYTGALIQEPRFLKHIHKGDEVAFSPENVLSAKRKKPSHRIRSIRDFVYGGSEKKYEVFKQVINDQTFCYAIDPDRMVMRTKTTVKKSIPVEKLDEEARLFFDQLVGKFESVELDKFHVKLDNELIKKSTLKIREKASLKSSPFAPPLIRVSDRTYLSFSQVRKVLLLLKKMLVYLVPQEDFKMLYFIDETVDGFISLAEQTSESIIVDAIEKL